MIENKSVSASQRGNMEFNQASIARSDTTFYKWANLNMHYNTHTNNNSVKFIKVSAEILSSNMSTRLGQLMLLCRSIPRSGLHTANVIIHQIAIFFKIHKCLVHDSNMSCAGRKERGTFDTYLSYRAYYTSHTSIHFRIT